MGPEKFYMRDCFNGGVDDSELVGWVVGDMCGTGDMDGVVHVDGGGGGYGRELGIWMGGYGIFFEMGVALEMKGTIPFTSYVM